MKRKLRVARQNTSSARVHVVPTITRTTSNLVVVGCGVCGRDHVYLRSDALDPQMCPWEPDAGVVMHIVLPSDDEAAAFAAVAA